MVAGVCRARQTVIQGRWWSVLVTVVACTSVLYGSCGSALVLIKAEPIWHSQQSIAPWPFRLFQGRFAEQVCESVPVFRAEAVEEVRRILQPSGRRVR
ncbi:hypothetical protein ACZ91_14425 [Streptomyces regensis]|nr:hypothetical protein ACZ91_14425 [Streptomyces regensis]